MKKAVLLLSLSVILLRGYASAAQPGATTASVQLSQAAPDNTGHNVRDRSGNTLTPGDQSSDQADVDLTRRIRKAVVADKSLSTTAHNIKIITVNGVVTLRGPVKSAQEKTKIEAKAQKLAGTKQVENQLEVAAH
jgi:osmotically-inducible protein OsmY